MQEPLPYRGLEEAIKTLEDSELSKKIKSKIKEFLIEMKMQNLGELRRRDYCYRLKKVAEWIPDSFLDPKKEDMKEVLKKLNDGSYSDWTIVTYVTMIKRFYKWYLGNNESYPDVVKWMKLPNKPGSKTKPEQLITKDEVNALISASINARDRALFSTLYDSGARIGEIITMKIMDLAFDEYGAIIKVNGKTGYRQVRIIGNSIPYLRAWLDNHPQKNNPDAWLFCNLSKDIAGRQLTYDDIHSTFTKTSKRAGIKRRIHPHLFRHTRATLLASKVAEAPLEAQMGWVHGSRQTRTYVHLSMRDQDNAILKAYGIEVNENDTIKEDKPKECPRCHELNPSDAKYCRNCWLPFDLKEAIEMKEAEEEFTHFLQGSKVLDPALVELVKNASEEERPTILNAISKILEHQKATLKALKEEYEGNKSRGSTS